VAVRYPDDVVHLHEWQTTAGNEAIIKQTPQKLDIITHTH
jgi:hypothetical protein